MNLIIVSLLAVLAGCFVTEVSAAPGETWEIVTKTESQDSPGTLPEISMNVCLQKGSENDPKMLSNQNENCEVSDVKSTKSKVTWKISCDRDGDKMTGSGEVTHKVGSFTGISKLSGTSDGEPVNFTSRFSGKKLGTPCDTESIAINASKSMDNLNEMMGMAKAQMASAINEQCEVSNYSATELISSKFFGTSAACPGKEKFACKVIKKEVVKDIAAYIKLAKHDDTSDISIAEICDIKMDELTKKVCAKVDANNFRELLDYCPSEAKAFEEEQSKPEKSGSSSGSGSGASGLIDNAIKLKGLFGF
ncbi:MAG: DUF3617 family protein [Desulfuromonadaceae bacterium]|nr:DUF3617 family protein [Desulfuromonadaceae bacterium]MDD2854809.1 DUF3617 family protein [Desulfuromonadaceae bacterium]